MISLEWKRRRCSAESSLGMLRATTCSRYSTSSAIGGTSRTPSTGSLLSGQTSSSWTCDSNSEWSSWCTLTAMHCARQTTSSGASRSSTRTRYTARYGSSWWRWCQYSPASHNSRTLDLMWSTGSCFKCSSYRVIAWTTSSTIRDWRWRWRTRGISRGPSSDKLPSATQFGLAARPGRPDWQVQGCSTRPLQDDVEEEVQAASLLSQPPWIRIAPHSVGAPLIPRARHQPHRPGNGEVPDAGLGRAPGVRGQPAFPCQLPRNPGVESPQVRDEPPSSLGHALCQCFSQPHFFLLQGKGVCPYDHLDELELKNDPAMPARDAVFSHLYNELRSDGDYGPALDVCDNINCTTVHQYLELYLELEVLLLHDHFDEFQGVCLRNYDQDPAHYVSSPQLSWNAMLRNQLQAGPHIVSRNFFQWLTPGSVVRCRWSRLCTRKTTSTTLRH